MAVILFCFLLFNILIGMAKGYPLPAADDLLLLLVEAVQSCFFPSLLSVLPDLASLLSLLARTSVGIDVGGRIHQSARTCEEEQHAARV
jgi:hypothetical protein